MEWLSSLVPCFVVMMLGLAGWNMYERSRFTRREGNLKRGVMVWAESLPWEARQTLENLPPITEYNNGFIRKEGSEVLIVAKRAFWQTFFSRRQWTYVGYINLSWPETRLELRLTWSTLVSLVVGLAFMLVVLFAFFSLSFKDNFNLSPLMCISPIFILVVFVGLIWFNHYRERKRLLDILNQITDRNLF